MAGWLRSSAERAGTGVAPDSLPNILAVDLALPLWLEVLQTVLFSKEVNSHRVSNSD
jgi:hypothetical protein